jgi:hypothetical protein
MLPAHARARHVNRRINEETVVYDGEALLFKHVAKPSSHIYAPMQLPRAGHLRGEKGLPLAQGPPQDSGCTTVDGPYNKDSTVKTSGSRGVYGKFHAHF